MTGPSKDPSDLDAFLQDPRFRRTFTLPANPTVGRTAPLEITYADFGYRNNENSKEENVLLFFAPLMSSRLLHVAMDDPAKKRKVRIIDVDRPGFGGTTEISDVKRMETWLEAIPALLKHLDIPHVAMAAHSAGTVYAFDMLLHHPEILDPERPYLILGTPWVLPVHTGVTTMTITQAIPPSILSHADKVFDFVLGSVAPAVGGSFGVSQAAMSLFDAPNPAPHVSPEHSAMAQWEEALEPRVLKHLRAETIRGLSSEALILMQKVQGKADWGSWKDYDDLAPKLAESLRAAGRKLVLEVFYAETDSMIGDAGTKGPVWFDSCWKNNDMITYNSSVITGANHETIWTLRMGIADRALEKVGQ